MFNGSVNRVILVGNIGKDPEVREIRNDVTGGGSRKMASFAIATSNKWKDRDGKLVENTEWHNIVIYNTKVAELVEQYIKKGMKVHIEGTLRTRKWQDNQGNNRYTTEVVISDYDGNLVLLSKGSSGASENNFVSNSDNSNTLPKSDTFNSDSVLLDDDIPF